jgi:Fic family protein
MILSVPEEAVGGLVADLSHRVNSIGFETVELVDRRTRKPPDVKEALKKLNGNGQKVLAAIKKGPIKAGEIVSQTKLSDNIVYYTLNRLRSLKIIRKGAGHKWEIV